MDLSGYKLVFEDDFNGSELDLNVWKHRGVGKQRMGYVSPDTVHLENGNLVIEYGYRNGIFGDGWYSGQVSLKKKFCKGYFEARMICNDPIERNGFWSAFWIQADHPYEPAIAKGGPGSAEIDIVEGFPTCVTLLPAVEHNIHTAGYPDGSGEGLRSMGAVSVPVENCYTEFHTYGLEWTDEVYRFYVDGKCTLETTWAEGVSQVEEEVIFSLCIPGDEPEDKNRTGKCIVDYIRIYQKD